MAECKTINKVEEAKKYQILSMNIALKGKIMYVTSSEKNNMFILTDSDEYNFYVIKKGKNKENVIESYFLKSEIPDGAVFQTNNQESQIWCNKLGTHVIIKYKNAVFYYNPYMKKKTAEMMLFTLNKYLQPYSVAFNDDVYEPEKTGKILFSDYNSSIYELEIELNEQKEMIHFFGEIFKFKAEIVKKYDETDEDPTFDFFEMEKDDRILDMKLILSKDTTTMGDASIGNEGKNIFILAITKNILFQFYGKDSYKKVFENYKLENGNILKAYKRFISKTKNEFKYSRIQLINETSSEKSEIIFGFMSKCGYMMGKLNTINPVPQKSFKVIEFYKPNREQKEELIRAPPKMVCQSINHIFFLHHDYLVIQNKLTNRIIHDEYLPYPYLDMYYHHISKGIIIYNENGIYKIPLENEFKYLFEDYIEIGNYESALELTKDEKKIRPKLHKLYAEQLFEQKQYLKAADEYAFSDEIFEHVCMKFLGINNCQALLEYLALVLKFRCQNKLNAVKDKTESEKDNSFFIDKYLIITWIFELIVGKNENDKAQKLIQYLRTYCRDNKYKNYINIFLIYYILNIYGKNKEYLEFANLRGDYKSSILSLIDHRKIKECLFTLSSMVQGGVTLENPLPKEIFFNYSNLFIKECPKESIDLLENYFIVNDKQDEIIKILNYPNYKMLAKEEENFKIVLNFIKKLIRKKFKILGNEIDYKKNANIHNLYILLSSYKTELYKQELIDYLMNYLTSRSIKLQKIITSEAIYFDLYFAKKIFEKKSDILDKKVLCILNYLLEQYTDSIDLALTNNITINENDQSKELVYMLAENIPDPKLRKKIWLKIFEYKKKNNNLSEAKIIISKSKNLIKIEDILPLMGGNVKINEFKDELKVCIQNYEASKGKLISEINLFNELNESINRDIDLSEKKAIQMNYTRIRCCRCNKNIRGEKYFLFPCKHIFDIECLIDTYIKFKEFNKIEDKKFDQKITVIKKLSEKIEKLKLKKKKANEYENKTKDLESLGTLQKLKTLNIKTLISKEIQKDQFSKEEELMLNDTERILYNYLDEECLLCGKEVIESIQASFGEENDFDLDL
jgi:uncharacterized glyoxalase superfamily protein PhnB